MPPKFPSVECVGSAALVSLWTLNKPLASCHAQIGSWGGQIVGNDSVIVANQLLRKGWPSKCRLLGATDGDVKMVKSLLGAGAVKRVGSRRGTCTRSLCLEDALGNRRWVFSRVPSLTAKLGKLQADITYVDYYTEFVSYLNRNLESIKLNKGMVMANLSAISTTADVPRLAIKPDVLQVSVGGSKSIDETIELAKQIAQLTGAQKVFITMGNKGAVLFTERNSWFSPSPQKIAKSILGAGAVFSAEVIAALHRGFDREALLQESVRQTVFRLEAFDENNCT